MPNYVRLDNIYEGQFPPIGVKGRILTERDSTLWELDSEIALNDYGAVKLSKNEAVAEALRQQPGTLMTPECDAVRHTIFEKHGVDIKNKMKDGETIYKYMRDHTLSFPKGHPRRQEAYIL